jgi:ATP-dependent Lon protease, bacterial type
MFAVSDYTREAGVRTLERKLGALCRAVAVRVAEMNINNIENEVKDIQKETLPICIDKEEVEKILGVSTKIN